MSRFNCKPISRPGPPPAPYVPQDKKPSAYAALKGREAPVMASAMAAVASYADEPEGKKRGRPCKEDVRKKKMALASASIAMLVTDKPTRKKIQEYMERRIEELNEEKR